MTGGNITKLKIRIGERELVLKGRKAWCLSRLADAGETGCTPIEYAAPRWSDYVFKLRRAGVIVETIDEKHGGAYRGSHARYVLRSPVEIIEREATP